MKLKHNDIHIPTKEENPDAFVNCKLNRKQYAEVLTGIVESYADGFVLAVNNPWGEGKTTFIKMWEQDLKNKGFNSLYFNAWENDFQEDVLIALLAELDVLKDSEDESTFKKVLEKATPLVKNVGVGLLKGLAKKIGADEVVQSLIDGTIDATVEGFESEIKSYTNRKKGIEDFRKSLTTFVKTIDADKPVVFFIDELDRCRPNYAVQVLEQIKHLFSVEGIVFVLSIDKVQLGHAVRGVYGSDRIDADEYLRRFVDLEYSIPQPRADKMIAYWYNYFDLGEIFAQRIRTNRVCMRDSDELLAILKLMFEGNNMSMRQMEKMFSHIYLCLKTIDNRHFLFPRVIILMIYIKMFELDIYNSIREKKDEVQGIINVVEGLFSDSLIYGDLKSDLMKCTIEFAFFYNNYYYGNNYPKVEIYERIEGSYDRHLTFKSKFDDDENNRNLDAAFKEINHVNNIDNRNLEEIINKIELLNPLF